MVVINDVLYQYQGSQAEVTIPEGVTCIGAEAFFECTSRRRSTTSATAATHSAPAACDRLPRPPANRSAQMAIQRVKEYAEQGYTQAVLVDLSKCFDTLNHDLLMNRMREEVHDKRVIELIKRFLKAGSWRTDCW